MPAPRFSENPSQLAPPPPWHRKPTAWWQVGIAAVVGFFPSANAAVCFIPAEPSAERGLWAFETGIAFITSNTIDDIALGDLRIPSGDGGGQVFSFTASRRLGDLRWQLGDSVFHPQVELPLTIGIVDENARPIFTEYRASVVVRWVEFPWNHKIKTSFATGIGFNYSTSRYLIDEIRHPGEHRSKLKFNWPLQVTFALPSRPRDELSIYIEHHSGGHLFDSGGVNCVGIGYRRGF